MEGWSVREESVRVSGVEGQSGESVEVSGVVGGREGWKVMCRGEWREVSVPLPQSPPADPEFWHVVALSPSSGPYTEGGWEKSLSPPPPPPPPPSRNLTGMADEGETSFALFSPCFVRGY